jgi:hypothetical protein
MESTDEIGATYPYEEGAAAYRKGVPFHQNPYDPVEQALAYEKWENGYWMASMKDESQDDHTPY